jgi:tRNA (mo5U34)-methyltransferase
MGFRQIRLVDVSVTSLNEQRATSWMQFNSLSDFLDPSDISRTVEGLPAPRRAIFIAEAPASA